MKDQQKLKGLTVEISGWDDSLPLQQDGRQEMEKLGQGRVLIRTGTAIQAPRDLPVADHIAELSDFSYLRAAKNIESDAPEIVARAKELSAGSKNSLETVKTLAVWTADYLKDSLDGNASALATLKAQSGNAQAHARLFMALARAAGIPTRYVTGLVSLEGKGFVYHSWAESLLGGDWVAVDPTYGQAPADPAHLKFITGDAHDDIAPLVSLIGRLRINILEMKYN
jgi:transglutaminase-like putative cysteine protease